MLMATLEKMRELAEIDVQIEALKGQRKSLDAEHFANVAKIRGDLDALGKTRETVLEAINADESVAKDLRKRAGRKPKTEEKTEEKTEGATPTPAKKRGAKDAAS